MIPDINSKLGSILASLQHHRQLLINKIVDNGLGNQCLLCANKALNQCLCPACLADLAWLTSRCPRCALPHEGDDFCQHCDDGFGPDFSLAVFAYQFPINALMAEFKYRFSMPLLTFFAERLTDLAQDQPPIDLIVPAPMHKNRLRQRGYNPSRELAKCVAARLKVSFNEHDLIKQHDSVSQKALHAEERRHNLASTFRWQGASLTNQHVVIIDDVMTTGATANALATCLKQAGAKHVSAWVIARTLPS